MAPSTRTRPSRTIPFKVVKAGTLNVQEAPSKQKLQAIEEMITKEARPNLENPAAPSRKRRRGTPSSDSESEVVTTRIQNTPKKLKVEPITPPLTPSIHRRLQACLQPQETDDKKDRVPTHLLECQALHKIFTQALAVHYAHHGLRTSISLAVLLPTMTRLWKKKTVGQQDIECLLAIWELAAQRRVDTTSKEIEHSRGPFRLTSSGTGMNEQTFIEFSWVGQSSSFLENELQRRYDAAVKLLANLALDRPASFLWMSAEEYPRLSVSTGNQTYARREKVTSIRDTILGKPTSLASSTLVQPAKQHEDDLSISDLKISSPKKAKTLSLFDRVRARQLLSSATSQPSSATVLRRRALARLPDTIPILRLKQAQKLNNSFSSSIHGSPSKMGSRTRMRVCFALDALVQEISDSIGVGVSSEELKEGINLLSREWDGEEIWCTVFENGNVNCVTLQGEGPDAKDIKDWVDRMLVRLA